MLLRFPMFLSIWQLQFFTTILVDLQPGGIADALSQVKSRY
jgi:hypothetical protein